MKICLEIFDKSKKKHGHDEELFFVQAPRKDYSQRRPVQKQNPSGNT